MMDLVSELAKEGVLNELMYVYDFVVLMSEAIEVLRNICRKWKEVFKSNRLEVNLVKTKVMTSGVITKDGLSKSKISSCGVCGLSVRANSDLCIHCGKWITDGCAVV